MAKVEKSKLGAPTKPDGQKIQNNHLRKDQQQWLEEQAEIRNISMYEMLRQCIDLARTAFDRKYGDASINAQFDRTLGEDMDGKKVVK